MGSLDCPEVDIIGEIVKFIYTKSTIALRIGGAPKVITFAIIVAVCPSSYEGISVGQVRDGRPHEDKDQIVFRNAELLKDQPFKRD